MKMLLLFLVLMGCNSNESPNVGNKPDISPNVDTVVVPPVVPEVVPEPGTRVDMELVKFSPTQEERLKLIKIEVEKIINSPQFKDKVVNFYTKGQRKFNETKDSNEKIYETLTAKRWDVKLELKYGKKNVLGWTNPSTPWVWFNSRYFDNREDSGLAGTFCHEMAHKFGYGHAFKDYNGREYTVPYGIGTVCAQLYKKI